MTKPKPPKLNARVLSKLELKAKGGHKPFGLRLAKAVGIWLMLTLCGLAIGMAGYMGFEGLSPTDAFVNAAMILSGMGQIDKLDNAGAKIFAGIYALFSGLIVIIATGFILAPIFHRVLHRFHLERKRDGQDQ